MQPTAVTTDFDHLRLADPAALFDAPGLDGAAIRAALVKALAAARPSADESAAHVRLCRIADAGRALLADRTLLAETIHFTQVAAPDLADTAPIAHIRLIALHRRGDTPATVAEADRVLQAGRLDPAGRKIIWASLRQWNIMGMLPPPCGVSGRPLGRSGCRDCRSFWRGHAASQRFACSFWPRHCKA